MRFLDNAFGIHGRALQVRSERLELLARNIANADTPSFKARDLDFKAVLDAAATDQGRMTSTRVGHYEAGAGVESDAVKYRVPFSNSFDGNTVEMHVEQAQYGKAAADYQATLHFLESRISSVRKALRGE